MDIRFDDKVVLITGATSGIGRSSAFVFADAGARLMLTGRNQETLEELKATFNKDKNVCAILAGDITDAEFRKDLLAAVIDAFGQLDVLVNAAGIIASGTIETTTLEDFDIMMDINLRSVFHLTQLAVPYLIKTSGNIVNVSSVTGTRAFPGILSYCVSKAGLDQLTRAVALELAPKNVRVNGVNPGVVQTNLHRRGGMDETAYQKFLEHSKTTHPLGRVGQPEEVAHLIVFLASDKAGWITGVTCSIDGGRQLTCAR
ncbi:MAG: glucose 1-dehydrogenase [Candidatus Aminicenantes bacterium]|nr:glucose 1-dehydrogenase [Candidatus Aminicenantes bacterium]NIM81191.1 glucose 1-dehydrogenase [Candidatus Aminicenantes bacterium]NIN20566.1 glucose 1-dehydrogenase [Candidatus Aminicenantes bacterium]NIN44345.1 glucose 1-dehydrogenase [Candidatus Aminicenantes bacterium]NIN87164.1 glucose 1-dehydrogenase [Candidatus Aminicenantes bacterium]